MGTLHRRRIALIAGCSHAAGHEIDGSFDSSYNRDHSYGNQLAKRMNRQPVNIACGGLSNTGGVSYHEEREAFREQLSRDGPKVKQIIDRTLGSAGR